MDLLETVRIGELFFAGTSVVLAIFGRRTHDTRFARRGLENRIGFGNRVLTPFMFQSDGSGVARDL